MYIALIGQKPFVKLSILQVCLFVNDSFQYRRHMSNERNIKIILLFLLYINIRQYLDKIRQKLLRSSFWGRIKRNNLILLQTPAKNAVRILIGIALTKLVVLSSSAILMILHLPVQEHGIWGLLFMSSLISFSMLL